MSEINPFDILSGKVVQTDEGTFYFKEPGVNVYKDGNPIYKNLHRIDGPAIIWRDGTKSWWLSGSRHRIDGPAVVWLGGHEEWYINDKWLTEEEHSEALRKYG